MSAAAPIFCLLALSICGIVLAQQNCPPKAENCLKKEQFDKLSQQDVNYCQQGAILAADAQNCLKRCGFSEADQNLADLKRKINDFCKTKDDKCDQVTDVYVNQTRCFDAYGGLDNLTGWIIDKFVKNQDTSANCQPFQWGRYCQRTQTCSFNKMLDVNIVKESPAIPLTLAICRSETIRSFVPALERSDGCKSNTEKMIAQKCNISCEAANAQDSASLCRLLESQAACLEENTNGCTAMEKRFLLPRLNTYSIFNKYLSCNIQYKGVPVKSANRDCKYSDLINSCLLTGTVENAIDFYVLQPLVNRDTPVIEFCKTKSKQSDMIVACRNAYIPCLSVQARLLLSEDSETIDSFSPEIGGFPLDVYGMKQIYDTQIPLNCPKTLKWSDRICVPDDSKRQVTDDVMSTTVERRTPESKMTPSDFAAGNLPSRQGAGDFERSAASTVITTLLRKEITPSQEATETILIVHHATPANNQTNTLPTKGQTNTLPNTPPNMPSGTQANIQPTTPSIIPSNSQPTIQSNITSNIPSGTQANIQSTIQSITTSNIPLNSTSTVPSKNNLPQ